jgi:hypothetical protein
MCTGGIKLIKKLYMSNKSKQIIGIAFIIFISSIILNIVLFFVYVNGFEGGMYRHVSSNCNDLPTISEVQKVVNEKSKNFPVITRVYNQGEKEYVPEIIDFRSLPDDKENCTGKAYLEFYTENTKNAKLLENKIGDTFYGIPYSIFND